MSRRGGRDTASSHACEKTHHDYDPNIGDDLASEFAWVESALEQVSEHQVGALQLEYFASPAIFQQLPVSSQSRENIAYLG